MLSSSERRFIKYWEEQREGGRTKYYLLYILVGTFISSIVFTFLSMMFALGFPDHVPLVVLVSFVIVTVATVMTWATNEKKFRSLIQREIEEGKQKDQQS